MTVVENKILVLPVMESFYTLQGEGFHQGKAAYFIRLAGCDVGCVWCDVKESWETADHPLRNVQDLVTEVSKTAAEIVVVTGGEPLMHNLGALTTELKNKGLKTHIETSGAYSLTGSWDWICVSPKKFKAPLPGIFPFANELKVVIYHKSDLSWAEMHAAQVTENCKLYLQPEWEKAAVMTPLIINYIKEHPEWELSLQLHKFINIP